MINLGFEEHGHIRERPRPLSPSQADTKDRSSRHRHERPAYSTGAMGQACIAITSLELTCHSSLNSASPSSQMLRKLLGVRHGWANHHVSGMVSGNGCGSVTSPHRQNCRSFIRHLILPFSSSRHRLPRPHAHSIQTGHQITVSQS